MSEHQTAHRHEAAAGCGCGTPAEAIPAGSAPGVRVTDPVCGMQVDPATSKHRHEHDGVTYHFCCGGCRAKFAANSAAYSVRPVATATEATTATDPVCGMTVVVEMSRHHADIDGRAYHFCSAGCRPSSWPIRKPT